MDNIPKPAEKFKELTLRDLDRILGHKIKGDVLSRTVEFLAMLSAFTRDDQLNVSSNGPTSSGKTYSPLTLSSLFPKENVIVIHRASPTAFFHELGVYDKETNTRTIDFDGKIMIFADQPDQKLLTAMRPVLSHDGKQLLSMITDKTDKGGHRTKKVAFKGYPVFIFCTASFEVDDQEATRFLFVAPEITQDKLKKGVETRIKRDSNYDAYEKGTPEE